MLIWALFRRGEGACVSELPSTNLGALQFQPGKWEAVRASCPTEIACEHPFKFSLFGIWHGVLVERRCEVTTSGEGDNFALFSAHQFPSTVNLLSIFFILISIFVFFSSFDVITHFSPFQDIFLGVPSLGFHPPLTIGFRSVGPAAWDEAKGQRCPLLPNLVGRLVGNSPAPGAGQRGDLAAGRIRTDPPHLLPCKSFAKDFT